MFSNTGRSEIVFKNMADAVLSQANPVSDTFYMGLATTANVRLISVMAIITWAVTQPTNLRVLLTTSTGTRLFTLAVPVSNSAYYININGWAGETNDILAVDNNTLVRPFVLDERSLKVEAAITWAITQPSPLLLRIKYAKM